MTSGTTEQAQQDNKPHYRRRSSNRMEPKAGMYLENEDATAPSQSAQANHRQDTPFSEASTVVGYDSESDSGSSSGGDPGSEYDSASEDDCADSDFYAFCGYMIATYKHEVPTEADHRGVACGMIQKAEKNWHKFCALIERQPAEATLKQCYASIFKAYLHWICVNLRIKEESSVRAHWMAICMYHYHKTKVWMENAVLFDVFHWISAELVLHFNLDTSKKRDLDPAYAVGIVEENRRLLRLNRHGAPGSHQKET
ncbi:hypothetical protein J7T55_002201 [Diaporthe amygdali]|uniref:uncharacterized protein n=1 Tax=Phomopsis amygdali TaxID=1214568 RepID=UPI0022FEAC2C|nr:uncharacterized protein J7T55_002201 [Diaporthe amygdali]KAJ0103782.1 hypothetical protein J7T55_002201 [Diaporthe amygdali]